MSDYTTPTKEKFQAFAALAGTGPVEMLNLIKLRDDAVYSDGTKATGAEAYRTYGRKTAPIFAALGGKIIWSGRPEMMLIGPDSFEDWDIAFIAQYPDASAFMTMMRDPEYQAVTHHRTAAIKTSRLIRMTPISAREAFGG
ncbi:MAG: DUF1330 domain-containing protein [Alphaproteobacteria bacterium]|nr:DUF1330 domain-containing protein [Alphaproteobacteria bacterium]